MKQTNLFWVLICIICISVMMYAQPKAKSAMGEQKADGSGAPLYDENESRNFSPIFNRQKPLLNHASLAEPVHLPLQNENRSYSESFPVVLDNGNIMIAWASFDSLNMAQSSDGGLTWGPQGNMALTITGSSPSSLAGIKTNTGRVIAVWRTFGGLEMSYSDNNGANWSAPANITLDGSERFTTLSQTDDGKLWLFYNRFNNGYDIYYRTSTDNGNTWDAEQVFLETTASEYYGTVFSLNNGDLMAVYQDNAGGNGDFDIYSVTSNDGGVTWSAPAAIVNSALSEVRPRVLKQSDGTLWMIYQLLEPAPTLTTFLQYDLYYTRSFDGGSTWEAPIPFTRYVNFDGLHNAVLMNNQPFISFDSNRWRHLPGWRHIWYGIIGITQDTNPPPAFFTSGSVPIPNVPVPIQAHVDDESGIADVQLFYTFNNTGFGPIQMFDDGMHNDGSPNDNIWGAAIGSFQIGDRVDYTFSITDIDANTVDLAAVNSFEITAAHHVGNVVLGLKPTSQLGSVQGGFGSNAHWPRNNGHDYLFDGGFWVGTEISGQPYVMNRHYGDEDWRQVAGSNITSIPGISDQDISMRYDDQLALSQPIGLEVLQESFQWDEATRDDFIILKYTMENTGVNGALNDVFAAIWLDTDVSNQTFAGDDLGGYDSQRGMIYMYDSQSNPSGYIGLKLLGTGNMPHTATIERPSFNDLSRYQQMTSGFPTLPTIASDWILLLTAPPFDLTSGNTKSVAFGLVMGDGLADLQANADTMAAIYNQLLVGIDGGISTEIPQVYDLAQNYPNPFNPNTTIRFTVANVNSAPLTRVKLTIYDITGREIKTLVDNDFAPGEHDVQWNAKNNHGENVAGGIYLYRISAGEFSQTRKMILLK